MLQLRNFILYTRIKSIAQILNFYVLKQKKCAQILNFYPKKRLFGVQILNFLQFLFAINYFMTNFACLN